MFAKLTAELVGTFWLVLGGCGSAVLAAAFPEVGIGLAGVSLAFGLTVLTGAYSLGPISGGHFNPAVTVGLWAGGRFPANQVVSYIVAQVVGAILGAAVLYVIASGTPDFSLARRLRQQRLRRTFARRLLHAVERGQRSGDDLHVPDRHPRCDPPARAGRLRRHRDRPGADADPPHQHPGHQHVGESGAQHRARRCSSAIGRSVSCGCSG